VDSSALVFVTHCKLGEEPTTGSTAESINPSDLALGSYCNRVPLLARTMRTVLSLSVKGLYASAGTCTWDGCVGVHRVLTERGDCDEAMCNEKRGP
jgi:hypothetical protein